MIWIDLTATRKFWSQMDTYRVGITKQSESTMHTLGKTGLTQEHFATRIKEEYLEYLNLLIEQKAPVDQIKDCLPEGFLQRRIICTSYKTLQNVFNQRKSHRLGEWREFCTYLQTLPHHNFICSHWIELEPK